MPMPGTSHPNASRHTGSQKALREANVKRIVEVLERQGPQTQVHLANATGLSRGTVSNLVHFLEESGRVETSFVTQSGRRAVLVSSASDGRKVVGIDIGRSHFSLALGDISGEVIEAVEKPLPVEHVPSETMPKIREAVRGLLEAHGGTEKSVAGAVVTIPASFDTVSGKVIQSSVFAGWAGISVPKVISEFLPYPVTLANDADMGAYAQRKDGAHAFETMLYVKVASGIGTGLLHDGDIFRSSTGISGEIGHTQVVENGEPCICGNKGCLETLAAIPALLRSYARAVGKEQVTLQELQSNALAKEPAALRILADAGNAIGRALATPVSLLGPDAVVVGGPLADASSALLEGIAAATRLRAVPAIAWNTEFRATPFGIFTECVGACFYASHLVRVSV